MVLSSLRRMSEMKGYLPQIQRPLRGLGCVREPAVHPHPVADGRPVETSSLTSGSQHHTGITSLNA